jgi:hypothetical protein
MYIHPATPPLLPNEKGTQNRKNRFFFSSFFSFPFVGAYDELTDSVLAVADFPGTTLRELVLLVIGGAL